MPALPDPTALYTDAEAARFLNLAKSTLRNWRWEGRGPTFLKTADTPRAPVMYLGRDLLQWIESRRVVRPEAA